MPEMFSLSASEIQELRESKARLEARAAELARVTRTLSETNRVLMRATSEPQLLQDACTVAVETGGYRLAWVGYAEHDEEKSIRPVAWAGADSGYVENVRASWGAGPRSQGPSGTSIREARSVVARNLREDPGFVPWRTEAARSGYRSSISLPLFDSEGAVFGAIAIYSDISDAFDADEEELLSELAGDLAYGIQTLRARTDRTAAEERAHEAAPIRPQTHRGESRPPRHDQPGRQDHGRQQGDRGRHGYPARAACRNRLRGLLHRSRQSASRLPTRAR